MKLPKWDKGFYSPKTNKTSKLPTLAQYFQTQNYMALNTS